MQINQLPSTSTVNSTDLLVKEQSDGTTEKIAISDFIVNNISNGNTNPVSSGGVYDVAMDGKTYTGSNSLTVIRVGRLAQMSVFPQTSTTAQSAVVGTITDSKFRPVTDIDLYTAVYNGSTYVNCWLQISSSTGDISIKSTSGAVVADYQAKYCKAKGLTWICPGA